MRCKKAALVINPRAGQNLAKITDVLAVLSAADWKTKLAIKEYAGHTMELANDVTKGSDLVIAYGGDGTLSQVINGVMDAKGHHPTIGLIPGGTGNVWAGEIGVPIDPVKAALSLVNSETRRIDVGHVAVQGVIFPGIAKNARKEYRKRQSARGNGGSKHHFLLMAGLGVDAAIMSGVSKQLKYRIGPLAVGLSVAKELPAQRAFPIEIYVPGNDTGPLWKGEGMQVVVGNTRRFGVIMEMTPNAYIDDGILDVCVITAGSALTTMQQISSLLLRRKPDSITAEYFHGAHLCIRVPATVQLQLDGSIIKLKDYLSKSDYEAVQHAGDEEQVMVSYRFDAMPRALEIAIPRTYDDALFEESGSAGQSGSQFDTARQFKRSSVKLYVQKKEKENDPQTGAQHHTEEHTSKPESQVRHSKEEDTHSEQEQPPKGEHNEVQQGVDTLLAHGRKITVVGKAPNVEKKQTYIIAGSMPKQSTGDTQPVAVVVNADTSIFNSEGQPTAIDALKELQEGAVIVVDGKKSKRGVIRANSVVV